MNTGGRRRPRGPLTRGLGGCALVLVVLSLWLSATGGRHGLGTHVAPSVSHSVAVAQVAFRPPPPDAAAVPVELVVLAAVLAGVLIGRPRMARRVPVRSELRHGRAPPGGFTAS